jgi:uncharacterized FlaG/YvyC family protein
MSEIDVNSINQGGYNLPDRLIQSGYQPAAQAASQATASAQDPAAKAAGKSPADRETASRKENDVSLEFKIDPDSQNVTVLILNKTSRKVIRTIPPEELSKLHEGDLVELFG